MKTGSQQVPPEGPDRVEHAFARLKTWKILRDCRLRGDRVGVAMAGVATLANLAHSH
jgi:hypothetical protein